MIDPNYKKYTIPEAVCFDIKESTEALKDVFTKKTTKIMLKEEYANIPKKEIDMIVDYVWSK